MNAFLPTLDYNVQLGNFFQKNIESRNKKEEKKSKPNILVRTIKKEVCNCRQ